MSNQLYPFFATWSMQLEIFHLESFLSRLHLDFYSVLEGWSDDTRHYIVIYFWLFHLCHWYVTLDGEGEKKSLNPLSSFENRQAASSMALNCCSLHHNCIESAHA